VWHRTTYPWVCGVTSYMYVCDITQHDTFVRQTRVWSNWAVYWWHDSSRCVGVWHVLSHSSMYVWSHAILVRAWCHTTSTRKRLKVQSDWLVDCWQDSSMCVCVTSLIIHSFTPRVMSYMHDWGYNSTGKCIDDMTHAFMCGEVGGWGRDPKKCTGRDWGMGSSTI